MHRSPLCLSRSLASLLPIAASSRSLPASLSAELLPVDSLPIDPVAPLLDPEEPRPDPCSLAPAPPIASPPSVAPSVSLHPCTTRPPVRSSRAAAPRSLPPQDCSPSPPSPAEPAPSPLPPSLLCPGALLLASHDPAAASVPSPGQQSSRYAIIVGGPNFGCGSSREHTPIALGATGSCAIVAEGYARIFFRNSVATGEVYPLEFADTGAKKECKTGDVVTVDLDNSLIIDHTSDKQYKQKPIGDAGRVIVAGGILHMARKQV